MTAADIRAAAAAWYAARRTGTDEGARAELRLIKIIAAVNGRETPVLDGRLADQVCPT